MKGGVSSFLSMAGGSGVFFVSLIYSHRGVLLDQTSSSAPCPLLTLSSGVAWGIVIDPPPLFFQLGG